ncbi:hypothetical protein [Noviherbaspirillum autotrophicum]|nr:hypothetical protein [Noviherbaspirillum autotrophicum]
MRFNLWAGSGFLLFMLGGCGGGGGDTVLIPLQSPDNPSGTIGAISGSGTTTTSASTPGSTPVIVTAVTAPQDGATLSGNVHLKIEGTNIQNAELLPATGYTPRLGVFVVAPDRQSASLVFNTTTIPNGTLRVRISAFNLPPGAAGASELIAMPPRTWRFDNQPAPFGTQEGRAARCQMMGFPYTDPSADLPVVCITGAPTSTPPQQCSNLGTGYGNPEDLLPVLRNSTPVSKLYCEPGANGGVINTGCVCLS